MITTSHKNINLLQGRAADLIAELADADILADLILLDPPWPYAKKISGSGVGASDHFPCMGFDEIMQDIKDSRGLCSPGGRALLWSTNSQDPEIASHMRFERKGSATTAHLGAWKWISGGAWVKPVRNRGAVYSEPAPGSPGMGFHGRSSECEPWSYLTPDDTEEVIAKWKVLLGNSPHRRADVPGVWTARSLGHSQKPVDLLTRMITGWVPEGGVVLDLYAGWGSAAIATLRAGGGRKYYGAEVFWPNADRILERVREEVENGPKD
mgnify:CR=1 FL=1